MLLNRACWRLPGISTLVLATALALASPAVADFKVLHWSSSAPDGSEVHVGSCLDHTPNRGFLAVTVTARNGLSRDRTWTLQCRAGYGAVHGDALVASTFPLTVPAQTSARHQFLIPLPTQFDKGRSTALQVSLLEHSVLIANGFLQSYEHNAWTSLALAEDLGRAPGNLESLSTEIRSTKAELHSSDPVAMLLAPESLPPDWRALSGLDALVLRTGDWRGMSPAVRAAVLNWIRLGRHLLILDPAGTAPSDLPTGPAGFGSIATMAGDPAKLPCVQIRVWLEGRRCNRLQNLRNDFAHGYPLQKQLGSKRFHSVFAFAILFVFAILVGPVNLFAWADSRRRHRLIFTVPLISGAACLLLILVILFQDGFGGTGVRAGLLQIFAGAADRNACLLQEQISRTGVLVQRGFPLGPGTVLSHVLLARSRWSYFDSRFAFRPRFALLGNPGTNVSWWSGDWFRSRSEQGHVLEDASPTRSRIERLASPAGAPPALVSSLDFSLSTGVYFDESGKPWRSANPVRPGDKLVLEECTKSESTRFLVEQAKHLSAYPARTLTESPRVNRLYAVVRDPAPVLIATLPGIRWREDYLLLVTEPVPRALAPP